jgi:adenosine kinase
MESMTALVCGSFAYDTIMVYPGYFKDAILPDKVHMLNVSFLVPQMRREFGGCAGNIAYNLKLLGGEGMPAGTVGKDFEPYADWLAKNGIDARFVKMVDGTFTAQAYITTDHADNQISAFHPGAMNHAHENDIRLDGIRLGIVSPDGRDGMIRNATRFVEAGIPFIFDPGQGMPMFNGDELKQFVEQAHYVAMNDYESELLQQRTGWKVADIAERVDALVITGGSKGSVIYSNGRRYDIPTATVARIADPTGCGDAYRAGLLYGIQRQLDWETTGRIASLMGAIKIEQAGTQNHRFTKQEFHDRFKKEFDFDCA